nr:unnamed protein product [Callosobruchus chinensis]
MLTSYSVASNQQVLLSTAVVLVTDDTGKAHECRALLDSGSQSNFVTGRLADKLQLPKSSINMTIVGITTVTSKITSKCDIQIRSLHGRYSASLACLVVPSICKHSPNLVIDLKSIKITENLQLADPEFYLPREVDILIGAGLFWEILCTERINLGPSYPILQRTRLGWITAGLFISSVQGRSHCNLTQAVEVQHLLARFWEIEECPSERVLWIGEQACEQHFMATHTRDLAFENENMFPEASQAIRADFYVDDLLTGSNSLKELTTLCRDVSNILSQGCFELRKWISNDPRALANIHCSSSEVITLQLGSHENSKTLGLIWQPQRDVLLFKIQEQEGSVKSTMRAILSYIAQIYDPLGLLSPCTIIAKILLQRLWLQNLTWDEPVPPEIQTLWAQLRHELPSLNSLEIPRHVQCNYLMTIQLHTFCDASEDAYCALAYTRSVDNDGSVYVQLLCAKVKVAPLKRTTLPRLELCGALIAARLTETIIQSQTCSF